MPATEVVRDMPPRNMPPIDESVKLPKSVRDAAARANSFYPKEPAEPTPAPQPDANAAPQPDPAPQPDANAAPEPAPAPQPDANAAPQPEPPKNPDHNNVNWEHRYNSMRGRYDASQREIGSMQEQLQQLGDELVRTQALIQNNQNAPAHEPIQPMITEADVAQYGPEIIDLARRAGLEAVTPKLTALENENRELKQKLNQNSQGTMVQALDAAVPNWREINVMQSFKNWLRLRDVYSGAVRQTMLNEAHAAANAPRVIAFFKGFLAEANATGQLSAAPRNEPPAAPAPREPAVPLSSLAAPGRARPASGDNGAPAEKPVFTRAQIAAFYSDVRQQRYAGREAEKARLENEIFAAQREGRVR